MSRWCGAGRPGKNSIKSPCCAVHRDSFIFGGIRKWRTNSFSPCHDLYPTCCFPFFLFLADDNFWCFGWYKISTLLWSGQEENGKYRASTHLDVAEKHRNTKKQRGRIESRCFPVAYVGCFATNHLVSL